MNPDLETYKRIVESSADAILVMVDLTIVYANRAAIELYGGDDQGTLVGQNALELGLLTVPQHARTEDWEIYRNKKDSMDDAVMFPARLPDGRDVIFDVRISDVDFNGENGVLFIIRDVTRIKDSEKNLRALHGSAAKLSGASDRDETAQIVLDTLTKILGMNYVAIGFVDDGYVVFNEYRGKNNVRKLKLDGPGITVRAINEGKTQVVNDVTTDPGYVNSRPEGSPQSLSELDVPVILEGDAIGVINAEELERDAFSVEEVQMVEILADHLANALGRIKHDTAVRDMREAHLLQLVGGIDKMCERVHEELKDPIQTIRNSSFIIRHNPDLSGEVVDNMDNSIEMMMTTLEEMREITSPTESERKLNDVYDILNQSIQLSNIPNNIELISGYEDGFLALNIDQVKIKRVFFNIIRNAIEAMPEGGALTIGVNSGDKFLEVSFRDTGPGIPGEVMDRMFQPFFTTKAANLGLGLSFSKLAVESSGGNIDVYSEPGYGTKVTVKLPM